MSIASGKSKVPQVIENERLFCNAQEKVRSRVAEANRVVSELKVITEKIDNNELINLFEQIHWKVSDMIGGLEETEGHIKKELAKLRKGIKNLNNAPDGELKEQFAEYVLEDTSLSLRNIQLTCFRHDDTMKSVKSLVRRKKKRK